MRHVAAVGEGHIPGHGGGVGGLDPGLQQGLASQVPELLLEALLEFLGQGAGAALAAHRVLGVHRGEHAKGENGAGDGPAQLPGLGAGAKPAPHVEAGLLGQAGEIGIGGQHRLAAVKSFVMICDSLFVTVHRR